MTQALLGHASYLFIWLRRIVKCIGPNQKNQPSLVLYLVRRYKICHFPIVVSYFCIGQSQKNQPNLILYLVRRYKICHFPVSLSEPTYLSCSEIENIFICLNLACGHAIQSSPELTESQAMYGFLYS